MCVREYKFYKTIKGKNKRLEGENKCNEVIGDSWRFYVN